MRPPPPRSTLFPYTTLFRSIAQGGQLMTTTDVDNWPADADGVQGPDLMQRFQKHAERFETELVFDHINDVQLDRKSTRLNSSHANISYAVFCLKKKINNNTT